MTEKPRGFIGRFKRALNLARQRCPFRLGDQNNPQKPFPKRQVGVVKNRIARYRELISAHVAIILAALFKLGDAFPFATRTLHAKWPAQFREICAAFLITTESLDEVHQVYV